MAMPFFIAPAANSPSDKVGRRRLVVAGLLGEGIGLTWLPLVATRTVPCWQLVAPMLLTGIGSSMALMTTPTAALSAVPPAAVSGARTGLLVGADFAVLGALVGLGIRRPRPQAQPASTPSAG